MKSPFVAFALSFFLPGAGLVYLGMWKWGILNLIGVLLIGVVAAFLIPDDSFDTYIRYIGYGCAGGSAGLANYYATQLNKDASGLT
jgi:hypothetical protein